MRSPNSYIIAKLKTLNGLLKQKSELSMLELEAQILASEQTPGQPIIIDGKEIEPRTLEEIKKHLEVMNEEPSFEKEDPFF
mmetsp:Transcript_42069/g.64490  ORF Transcript_42069/g.64490 Transcript_42069/m.64490 type:complete len:81 (-) Transcript_42069:1088-1330(-)